MSQTAGGQPPPPVAPASADEPSDPPPSTRPASRLASVKATAKSTVSQTQARVEVAREKVPAVDVAFTLQERDRRLAGNLLASALAYRLFLWLLPVLLVLVAILGFLRDADPENPGGAAKSLGLSRYVASEIASASEQAQRSRWILIAIGLVALYSASTAGIKALRAVHALIWNVPMAKPRSMLANAAGFVAFALAALVATAAAGWLRQRSDGPGVLVSLGVVAIYGALWLVASLRLPHADCPWTALVPGAVLFSAGAQVLHLVTVYYLTGKLQSSSELYGALGAAAAVLLWLFFIGRLIVASALLNATLWERGRPHGPAEGADGLS
jgi:uncharacterized BrkB/YihY/UPF0761 family membrane protein